MTDLKTIAVDEDGAVATVSLNRPEVRNAMNPDMIAEIGAIMHHLNADPAVRVIVLRGNGRTFCAGGDLNWMRDVLGQSEDQVAADSRHLLDMYRAIADSPKLVVARLHGAAVAGALGVVACADVAIAERNATFCVSEVRIGLVPGIIAAFLLPRMGPGWFGYLAKTATPFDAETARLAGLVHEVADDEADLDGRVAAQVERGLQASPDAIEKTGRLIADLGYRIDEETFDTGLLYNAKARLSAEAQEGISAFLEKRRPAWDRRG